MLLHLICIQLSAQLFNRPAIAAYYGLGAYSLKHTDGFSFVNNPAALAQVMQTTAGAAGSRRFLLADLAEYTAATAVTTTSGNFGLRINYAGSAVYKETQAGIAYGRKLGSKADVGLLLGYNTIHISSGYGAASSISAEAGITLHLTEQLHTGIHINRAGKFEKDNKEEALPVYTVGLGYEPSGNFLFSAEIEKAETMPVNINAGIQYNPVSQVRVRAGISSATSSVWFGAGIGFAMLRLDVFTAYHPRLGVTPGILLLYHFNKDSK